MFNQLKFNMSLLKVIYHTKKTTHGLTKNIICDNLNVKYY